jgi:two-component system, chemotaxis family, chemotaxis protein CheY
LYARDGEVLIVDDYASMRRIMRALLAHIGFDSVQEAADGPSAIVKMRERRISLVIADLDMTPMTGVDFVTTIRAHSLLKDTPVIVTTADADRDQLLAARMAGANTYIVKPFDAATLKQKIDAVLTEASSAPA